MLRSMRNMTISWTAATRQFMSNIQYKIYCNHSFLEDLNMKLNTFDLVELGSLIVILLAIYVTF